jgi:hypothetical protein
MQMKTPRLFLISAILGILPGVAFAASSRELKPGQICLQITETEGIDRRDSPVTSGIPFPRGAVKDEQQVVLFDPGGKEVPLQTTVLSRYWEADGSIRWLLLDFQANVPARETVYYTVRYGEDVVRHRFSSALSTVKQGSVVKVNTGVLHFSVSKDFLTDIEVKTDRGWQRISSRKGDMRLAVGPPPNPEYLPVVTGEGRNQGQYSTLLDPNVSVVVEDAGPLRVQVKVEGWHVREDGRRFGPFTLRVNAFSGKPYVQVFHTFVNSDLPERGLIKNVGMKMSLDLLKDPERITFGSNPVETLAHHRIIPYLGNIPEITFGSNPVETPALTDIQESCYLLQNDWNRYRVVMGREVKEFEGQSHGWLDVTGKNAGVEVVFSRCAQLFPKELKVQGDVLSVWMYPEDDVGPLDLRRSEQKNLPDWQEFKEKYPKLYAAYLEPTERMPSKSKMVTEYRKALENADLQYLANHSALGFSRTHEIYFYFHSNDMPAEELTRFASVSNEPLRAYALDTWYDYTNTLGHFGWQDTVNFPLVENYFTKKVDWAVRHQNEWFPSRFWGIVNYGGFQASYEKDEFTDTSVPGQWLWYCGGSGWVNFEVDGPYPLLLYYLRTGDRKTFNLMEWAARQMMDVVTAHANLPDFGSVATTPTWKKGGMNRHEYDPYGGGVLENHTWNEGIINYYYLTGYRRAYDVAMEIGDFALRVNGGANRIKQWQLYEKQFDRNSSNNWRILLKSYELTGEERFRREAEKWREFYLKNSPYSYQGLPQAAFMTVRYTVPTYVLDYRLFGDERVAEEVMKIARWLSDLIEKSDDGYVNESFLAPALSFDVTRGGGPLEALLKKWWKARIPAYQRQEPVSTAMDDFTTTRWDEFLQMFYFLAACRDANITEKNPPQ